PPRSSLFPYTPLFRSDFAAGADPVLESIELLVAEIRRAPGAFRDTKAIVQRSGFGSSRVFELFRLHYHQTPADLLLRARLEHARDRKSTRLNSSHVKI